MNETQEAFKEFFRTIFEDTKHSLAKQVLKIAIIEGRPEYFINAAHDFELTIELTKAFTLANAREYFYSLA